MAKTESTRTTGFVFTDQRTPKRLPADWEPNANHERFADELGLDVHREAFLFREHAKKTERVVPHWNAAFTRWLRQAVIYAQKQRVTRERSR